MQPGPKICKVEKRLRLALETADADVTKAIKELVPVASCLSSIEASLFGEGPNTQAQQSPDLGKLSKCLLALFCGSARQADKELAQVELEPTDSPRSDSSASSFHGFGG